MSNGAQALIRTLVDAGVDVCFTNPGTSEMHFVAALDAVPEMRGALLALRARATGAADGYARMADARPPRCCTSGPASATGWPTCTTPAGRSTPIVNIVGDHATYHTQYDAQLAVRHRDRGPQRLDVDAHVGAARRRWPRTRPRRSPPRSGRPARWRR